jgi:hypothetical protein
LHSILAERYSGIRHQFYSDTSRPDLGIRECSKWPFGDPERRFEQIFSDVLAQAQTGVDWFIFTHSDTWWHLPNLGTELHRIESVIAPAAPVKDFLVVGGGGYVVFDAFMILSKPALAYLSNCTVVDACRTAMNECKEYEYRMPNEFAQMVAIGCHHSGPNTGRKPAKPYSAANLVNYCAAAPLAQGKCGPRAVGCEWRFGRLARDEPPEIGLDAPSNNEMARRRFRQNHKRGQIRLMKREWPLGMQEECVPVMCALVGFEKADNETQVKLENMVRKQAALGCCDNGTAYHSASQSAALL